MSTPYTEAINKHYGQANLTDQILAALERVGKDVDNLDRGDLYVFDEFHIRGRQATREMAQLVSPLAQKKVLDIGCGIGGPARTLAAEFDCTVTGLDIVKAYCDAAIMLTERVGLADQVTFRHGSALDLPFEANTFDVVWTQHISMNIEDKSRLFSEIARVVRPGGKWILYEAGAGAIIPIHFPVPWANDETLSFLIPPDVFRRQVLEHSFQESLWQDVSADSLAWFKRTISSRPNVASPLSIELIAGDNFAEKGRNIVRNLAEGRLVVIQAVFKQINA